MHRMRHSSTRAAMIYMHDSDARQHEIAATVSNLGRQELRPKAQAVSDHPKESDQARGGHGRAWVPLEGDGPACRHGA